ncbi:MAG: hypothetical protein ICV86_07895 [Microcoleus sp. T3-bin5]|nr:hypothetical protein [Microcoleus sp. T3-bin5]
MKVNVEAEHEQRIQSFLRIDELAVFESILLSVCEHKTVAVLNRLNVNAQLARCGERFIPDFGRTRSVRLKRRALLHEGQCSVPRTRVLLLHRREQVFGGFDFGRCLRHKHREQQ